MRKVVGMAAGLALLLVIGVAAFAADASVEHGKEVYAAQKCQMCHSIAGVGNKKYPLDGIGSKMKAEELKKFIKNPKESKPNVMMKAYALPEKDLADLTAYMLTLK
jgi:cytochrome c2